jgi:hypothetical protein
MIEDVQKHSVYCEFCGDTVDTTCHFAECTECGKRPICFDCLDGDEHEYGKCSICLGYETKE